MHARVVSAQTKPGMVDEALDIHHGLALPVMTQQPGYQAGLLLVNRRLGHFIMISLWESEAAMHAGEQSGYFQEQVNRLRHTLLGPNTWQREHYEVGVEAGVMGKRSQNSHARVTTGQAPSAAAAEATQIFRDDIVPAAEAQSGFVGALFLTEPQGQKLLGITIWESEEAMHAGERTGYYHAQAARLGHLFSGPIAREHYEVLAHL